MKLTEARWQIVKASWQKHPAAARNITDRLPSAGVNGAGTTVKTLLTRLPARIWENEAEE